MSLTPDRPGGSCTTIREYVLNRKGKGKTPEEPPTAKPENPQLIRIVSNGKTTAWIAFALDFLEVCSRAAAPRVSVVTSTISRLISVVEIIKREYVKKLELQHSSTLTGLHRYNEMGTLEDLGLGSPESQESEDARPEAIAAALEGKTHLKMKDTPFMKITLSRTVLIPAASDENLSKSAKARAKRREK
ncbi:hypothetical protein C8J57DRAFT_1468637 [Mycena rebaudengoi]|nr:hypothetical protein C8J57DRAFT_1468637 [Mycena rebaudengoi]